MSDIETQIAIQALAAQIRNIAQSGVIVEIDFDVAKVKVEFDKDYVSDWLPWTEVLAGKTHTWRSPKMGDQAIVLALGGNVKRGVILGYLNHVGTPQISTDGDLQMVEFANGTKVSVQEKNNIMSIKHVGSLNIHSTGDMRIVSDTDIALVAPHIGYND